MFRLAPLAFLGAAVALAGSVAADPPPKLTPGQREKVAVHNRLMRESERLGDEGKVAEARAAVEKCLVIEREVLGEVHPDVVGTLESLSQLSLRPDDLPAARKYARDALAVRTKLRGETRWQTTDARVAPADVDLLAGLPKEKRAESGEADRPEHEVIRLYGGANTGTPSGRRSALPCSGGRCSGTGTRTTPPA